MSTLSADSARRSAVALSDRRTSFGRLLRAQFAPKRVSLVKPVNVGLMAELAAERHGRVPVYLDQPFTWDPQQRLELDYVEVATLIGEMSAALKAAGVTKRDRVVILKTPNYDIQSLAWAAARIGAVPALLSARLDPNILNILLERIGARFIITDPAVAAYAGLDGARLRELNCTAIAPIDGGIPVEDLWGGPVPAPDPGRDDEPMMITHTSSTTGVSKLAEASATGVSFSAFMESVFPFLHSPDDLFASVISHVHIRAAVTQQAAFSRGTPLLGIASHDDATITDLFGRYRPTIAQQPGPRGEQPAAQRGQPRERGGSPQRLCRLGEADRPPLLAVREPPPVHEHLRRHPPAHHPAAAGGVEARAPDLVPVLRDDRGAGGLGPAVHAGFHQAGR